MLTIIVPIYNSEKYLDTCLNSIQKQLFKDFEVILVDNNSTDRSISICNEYIKKDSRFRLCREASQGAAYCRNKGLKEARGDYITFVDSDDYLSVEAYMLLMKKIIDSDADLICYSYNYVDESGALLNWDSPRLNRYKKSNYYSGRDVAKIFLVSEDIEGFCWNKIFKKRIFDDYLLRFETEKKAYEDMAIVFKAITCCQNVLLEPQKLYHYRQISSSLTHQDYNDKKIDYYDSLKNICEIASLLGLKKEANVFYSSREILLNYDKCIHEGQKIDIEFKGFIKKLLVILLNYKSNKIKMIAKGSILFLKSIRCKQSLE